MRPSNLSVRVAVAAIGALCGAIMIPSLSYAVGAVQVNGSPICASNTNMSMNPAGDISIVCTAPGTTTTPTTPPVCTVSVSPVNITVGQTSNISAVCNPAATSYQWTMASTAPAVSNAGGAPSFPTAGTYYYQVTGSNGAGAGLISNMYPVVVAAATTAPPPPPSGSCTTTATGAFADNGVKLVSIDRSGYVSYALPVYTAPSRTLEILSIQSTASAQSLMGEFSISTCPGDYTVPDMCKAFGSVNQSGMQLYAVTSTGQVTGACTLIYGTQYYLNARNVKSDRVTPSCTAQTCYMNIQLNSYF
jgi:hypothetical protein